MDSIAHRRAEVRRLFEELITAYGGKDFDTFKRYVHPDAEFDWPYLPLKEFPDRMVGRDQFIATSISGMADCDGYHHQVDRFYEMADPDMLLVEYHSETVLRSNSRNYANKYLGILRFENNLVVYWREYINPLPVIEAFGLNFQNAALA
ncbi:nuclear transport factor 2 family protein [Sphingomonas jatrophae]|uniref:Ketosteroid isomerase-related protein n=1 Tax=Sphingomonas jatrophae TaxID=1166337 RepID=A0A1I6KB76_9SPHN|nr:nuclear transport factor 2 family protein [Sphingomonas jatrophae]SFR88471.1 Ketosteroid isomerase-related protein [Sphingomonas jatrophae]